MADNSVFISGSATGALKEALDGLPPWATQNTAEQLEKYLRLSYGVQQKSLAQLVKTATAKGTGLSPAEIAKANDELDDLIKNLSRANDEEDKQFKRTKRREEEENKRDKKSGDSSDALGNALKLTAAAGSKVIAVNKDYINVYDSMYKSGINVLNGNNDTASGFEALNMMVNQTGLRLQTLQVVAEKYSTTVNAVGMAKFAKTLGMSNTRLVELGYSSEAQAELIGTLMEAESGYTDIRNKTAAQLSDDAIKLGNQLGKLSQTVGLSRDQLQENLKANSKSTQAAMVFARFGKDAADKLNAATAGIKDSGLRNTFMELAAAANPAQVKGYNELVQAGLGDVANQMSSLAKAGMHLDPAEFQQRLSALTSGLETQTGKMGNLSNLLGKGGEEAASILNGLYQQGRGVSQASADQATNATKTQKTVAALQTEVESLAASLQKAFFPMEEQVELLTAGLGKLNGVIDKLIGSIDADTRSWVGIGLSIASVLSTVATTLASFKYLGVISANVARVFTGLIGAFTAGYAIGTLIYNLISDFEWATNMFDAIFGAVDSILQHIPGLGTGAKERVESRARVEAAQAKNAGSSTVSVTKTPAPSMVDSPSAVSAPPAAVNTNTVVGANPAPVAMASSPTDGSINTLLNRQGIILEQILAGTTTLVSVNKDILKYARSQ